MGGSVNEYERREIRRDIPTAMGMAMVYFCFTDLSVYEQIAQWYI